MWIFVYTLIDFYNLYILTVFEHMIIFTFNAFYLPSFLFLFQAKLSSGLALKKKNIPSLVEKWQKIKEEQEKEDKDSEDPRN